jgi:hypothetical protein
VEKCTSYTSKYTYSLFITQLTCGNPTKGKQQQNKKESENFLVVHCTKLCNPASESGSHAWIPRTDKLHYDIHIITWLQHWTEGLLIINFLVSDWLCMVLMVHQLAHVITSSTLPAIQRIQSFIESNNSHLLSVYQ